VILWVTPSSIITTPTCRDGRSGHPTQGGEQTNRGRNPRAEPHL